MSGRTRRLDTAAARIRRPDAAHRTPHAPRTPPPMSDISGIHHITCLAGDPQENLAFYRGVLGMRLVKRSVNQDDPGTYHLFYADAEGHPGTDLTFFPSRSAAPGRKGVGLGFEVSLAVPKGSLAYWSERLHAHDVTVHPIETRRGNAALPFIDPHGLEVALVETGDQRDFTPWDKSPIAEEHQIRGLHAVRMLERDLALTANFLTGVLGFDAYGDEEGWYRYGVAGGGSGKHIEIREDRDAARGQWGKGTMHHVAWRVPDDQVELAVRARVDIARRRPTEVIDRFWFKSVYFLEPGGVLFEIATDGPGFTADEELSTLGEHLVLPPWLEPFRDKIEAGLPPLDESRV
jgi:glyoxalase family protein